MGIIIVSVRGLTPIIVISIIIVYCYYYYVDTLFVCIRTYSAHVRGTRPLISRLRAAARRDILSSSSPLCGYFRVLCAPRNKTARIIHVAYYTSKRLRGMTL